MRLVFIFSIALISCTGNSTHEKTSTVQKRNADTYESKSVTEGKEAGRPGKQEDGSVDCYWQVLKRDTFVASLAQTGDIITGKLSFDHFEKDASVGKVLGKNHDGIMKLWYSFESEGMKSVMEVWLKKQGDILLRGIGDMNVKSDTSYFINPTAVDFSGNLQMKKVDCSKVPLKYK